MSTANLSPISAGATAYFPAPPNADAASPMDMDEAPAPVPRGSNHPSHISSGTPGSPPSSAPSPFNHHAKEQNHEWEFSNVSAAASALFSASEGLVFGGFITGPATDPKDGFFGASSAAAAVSAAAKEQMAELEMVFGGESRTPAEYGLDMRGSDYASAPASPRASAPATAPSSGDVPMASTSQPGGNEASRQAQDASPPPGLERVTTEDIHGTPVVQGAAGGVHDTPMVSSMRDTPVVHSQPPPRFCPLPSPMAISPQARRMDSPSSMPLSAQLAARQPTSDPHGRSIYSFSSAHFNKYTSASAPAPGTSNVQGSSAIMFDSHEGALLSEAAMQEMNMSQFGLPPSPTAAAPSPLGDVFGLTLGSPLSRRGHHLLGNTLGSPLPMHGQRDHMHAHPHSHNNHSYDFRKHLMIDKAANLLSPGGLLSPKLAFGGHNRHMGITLTLPSFGSSSAPSTPSGGMSQGAAPQLPQSHAPTQPKRPRKKRKPYTCEICGSVLQGHSTLVRHMRIHTGEKPFKCSVCAATFRQKGTLASHMVVHTGETPFNCEFCGEKFRHRPTLKRHRERVHAVKSGVSAFGNTKRSAKRKAART